MSSGEENSAKSGAKEILSHVFSRIGELSDAWYSEKSSKNISNSDGVKDTVESKVSRASGQQHALSSSIATASQSSASTLTQERFQNSSPSRRYFHNQHSSMKSSSVKGKH